MYNPDTTLVSFPGISKLGYVRAEELPANTTYNALVGMPLVLLLSPTEIPMSGYADLQVEQSNDRNGTAESLTLTFRSALRLPRHYAVAFVIKTANGQCYLVGQSEKPSLAIKATQVTGTPDGEAAVYNYEVKESAPVCLKPCRLTANEDWVNCFGQILESRIRDTDMAAESVIRDADMVSEMVT